MFAGNMSFTPSADGDSCKLDKTKAALACAALLGITLDGLSAALTSRSIILAADEILHSRPLTFEESGKACEAGQRQYPGSNPSLHRCLGYFRF